MPPLQETLRLSLDWMPFLLTGFSMTVILATGALMLSIVIGGIAATMNIRGNAVAQGAAQVYTTIVRSVPELIVVYYFYFGVNQALDVFQGAVGMRSPIQLPVLAIAFLSLAFIGGALAAEVFRTAYKAVPQSEIVAGKAFAMTPFLLFRRVLFPHILRYSLPGFGNIWIGLLKESALISVMGVTELMRATTTAANSTGQPFVFYLLCTALYLAVALASGGLFSWLERRHTV